MSQNPGLRTCPQCGALCQADSQYCPQCGFPIGAVAIKNDDPMVGRTLPGGYQVLGLIGIGGMGRVYRAEQRILGRTVAVKVIHPHLLADEKSLSRFLTEARATSQLNHPNIVSVIDFGKLDDEKPYLVMEYLRGQNLAQVHSMDGPFTPRRIIGVLRQVLLALGEAHELGIIHRDLKPENIVLEPMRRGGDFVKVVDFGLAKLKAEGTSGGITMPGIVCGTPDFMAPEQGRGDSIDGRADLYAVGVVLYWLLTGRLPFESESPTQVVLMHIGTPVPNPREVAPHRQISDGLLRVVFRALAKSPRDRFADAHEFADALEDCLAQSERVAVVPETMAPLGAIACPSCLEQVPRGRFCLNCGRALPSPSANPPAKALSSLPLLGRDEELRWLAEALAEARGTTIVARIVGEPGVGKTRLLQEFAARALAEGHACARLSPDPYGAEVLGFGLKRLVPELLGGAPAQRDTAPALRAVWSDLEGNPSALQPAERRTALRDLLTWAIGVANLRSAGATVIVIDDLHRIDGVTRRCITDVLEASRHPLMVITAHSPNFSVRFAQERVRLMSGLPAHLATELLRRGDWEKASGVALAEIGNRGIPPLYVEQVLALGFEGGGDPPARLPDLLAQRLATLPPELRHYVQAIAVLGEDVPAPQLTALLGSEPEQLLLDRLVAAHLVARLDSGNYSLAHPLLRDLTLHATPAEVRRELHAKALSVLQDAHAPLEVLAEHAVHAQDSMMALFFIEQVAERAHAWGDDQTESFILRRGLEIARQELYRGQLEDPMRAIAIFGRRLGLTLTRIGQFSDAEGVLLEALDSTDERGAERIEVLRLLAEAATQRQRAVDAERYLAQALRYAESGAHHGLASTVRGELARVRGRPNRSAG